MHRGYIKLWRKIENNFLWSESRVFSRAEAWIDMLILANHKAGTIRKRGILIEVDRGEIAWSEIELANRWKWSRGKVRRFLSELSSKTVQQIEPVMEQQNRFVTSRYRIVNYDLYHGNDTANSTDDETASSTANGQQTDSKRYRNKNDKNEKNEKEYNLPRKNAEEIYKFYVDNVKPERRSKGRAVENITDYLGEYSFDDLIASIKNFAPVALSYKPKFRKDPANFFGKRERFFSTYIPENFVAQQKEIEKEIVSTYGKPIETEEELRKAMYGGAE